MTDSGIDIEVRFAKVDTPGLLRDRVELAWQEIEAGLVGGLSVGFLGTKTEPIHEKGYGTRYLEWEWVETSAVTIPALPSARIETFRSEARALRERRPVVKLLRPGCVYYRIEKPLLAPARPSGRRGAVRITP